MTRRLIAGRLALLFALTAVTAVGQDLPSFTPLSDLGAGLYLDQF